MRGVIECDVESDVWPVVNVNLLGTMRVNHAVFDLIWASKGVYVNIASVAGRIGAPGLGPYCASKHAVVGYSSSMRRELAPHGVRVVCLEPGFTRTPMLDTPLGVDPDLSQTRLLQPYVTKEVIRARMGDGVMQSADDVAAHALTAFFADGFVPPHMLCERRLPLYVLYSLGSVLPFHWLDALLQLQTALEARRFGKASQ